QPRDDLPPQAARAPGDQDGGCHGLAHLRHIERGISVIVMTDAATVALWPAGLRDSGHRVAVASARGNAPAPLGAAARSPPHVTCRPRRLASSARAARGA